MLEHDFFKNASYVTYYWHLASTDHIDFKKNLDFFQTISEWNSWFWISVRFWSSKWSTGALSHNALSQVCLEWWQFTWGHIWDRRQFYPLWILLLPTFPYQSLRGKMFVDMECQNFLHVNSIVYFAILSKVFLQTYKRTAIKKLIIWRDVVPSPIFCHNFEYSLILATSISCK